ncbi:hypothetical protein DV701_06495 [Ornithinimicrobium avium]|uniref:Endonuclease/exonuclease/phosphatase domain-containing protein n=1 Tax=Ornithinimicrobium avium TaxID=2283195 RepID=A0A345NLB6_9MICO|nr:hypothetical protein DV701_06495 [Ornithinimicrobium avium]
MAGAVALLASVLTPIAATAADGDVFISEIHYDNASTDVGEAIEVQAPVGSDLTGWSVVLYNGDNGAVYDTDALTGTVPDAGVVVVNYPENGIQNGAPDGIALVDAAGGVVEFLSYEGTMTALGGPADGRTSTDIGVQEGSSTPVGHSLQKIDGVWTGPATSSFGMINGGGGGADPGPVSAFISEIHYDNASTDVGEAIEVQAPVGSDLTGWSVVLYNGDNGAVYDTDALTGTVPDAGVVVVNYPENGIQNGAPDGIALVDAAGNVVEFLSYEGTMTALGGPADGRTSTDIGVQEGSSTPVGHSLQKIAGVWTGPIAATFGIRNSEGGGEDPGDPGAQVCDVTDLTLVGAVQGSGASTPMPGASVTVRGTVVGYFPDFKGFFLQDDGDTDPATSDGIFVFTDGPADVSVGDEVAVTGTAKEAFTVTQLADPSYEVCASETQLPEPTEVTMPLVDHEPYESMYITFPQDLAIQEYYGYGRYGEIVLGLGDDMLRQYQPTAVYEPGSAEAAALAEYNAANRITLDDGLSGQNPAFLRHPNGEAFTLDNRFRGGDLVTDATGVLDYRFNLWRIQPTEGATYTAANPRPAVPEVGGTTTVGSFNVLNYFTTLTSQDPNARGADTPEEFARQQAKIVAAINAMDADVVGLIEIENNGDVAVSALVEALNAAAGEDRWDYVPTGKIGTDAITTAFIYQPELVEPVGDFAILDSTVDARFLDDKNRPALAQTFADLENDGQVTVVVNHLKSKGSACDDVGDPQDPDGQGNCNLTRTNAADALGDWANGDPTETGTDDVLIIGDLNSYDKEDPIDALKADGFSDLLLEHVGEFAYSYVFDGMLGYLDYAMASASLDDKVTGAQAWHINADEPSVLDYDMSFKPPAQDVLWAPDAYRSSDHDPVLVGLELGVVAPPSVEVDRWGGDDRYGTAAKVAEQFGEVNTVYVASGLAAADALVGASPAANGLLPEGMAGMASAPDGSAAPVLLTRTDRLPAATASLLEAISPADIVLLGGTSAVNASVETELQQYGDVVRVPGQDRYDTAAMLADLFDPAGQDVVFLAAGNQGAFADALTGSAAAGSLGSPVLLTRTDRLPAATADALVEMDPSRVVVLGGESAVTDAVLDQVRAAVDSDIERIFGDDRYQTAIAVSTRFVESSDVVLVASGRKFPDALTGAAYAGAVDAPVLLTRPDELPAGLLAELDRLAPSRVVVLGGTTAVSSEVQQALEDWAAQP